MNDNTTIFVSRSCSCCIEVGVSKCKHKPLKTNIKNENYKTLFLICNKRNQNTGFCFLVSNYYLKNRSEYMDKY